MLTDWQRNKYIQTDTEKEAKTQRHKDRQTEAEAQRHTDIQTDKEVDNYPRNTRLLRLPAKSRH